MIEAVGKSRSSFVAGRSTESVGIDGGAEHGLTSPRWPVSRKYQGVAMRYVPLLADFSVRLSFGLILALLLTSWREVPIRFFRIQNQVILGTLVLAALDQSRSSGPSLALGLIVGGVILSYLLTVSWGLGLPQAGMATGAIAAAATVAWMIDASRSAHPAMWAINASSRIGSGALMGATLTGMLLGHYYLIAPAMTTEPLKRTLRMIMVGLVARVMLAGIALWAIQIGLFGTVLHDRHLDSTFLAMRWGMGFVGVAISVILARRTAEIRSTQSATGILYITTIFVLFGELASLVGAGVGVIC